MSAVRRKRSNTQQRVPQNVSLSVKKKYEKEASVKATLHPTESVVHVSTHTHTYVRSEVSPPAFGTVGVLL